MAKKARRSQPVPAPKEDGNVIHIELGPMKFRAPILPGRRHHTRERDVLTGRRRNPKHKGRQCD